GFVTSALTRRALIRYLLSFPTRRSSDLAALRLRGGWGRGVSGRAALRVAGRARPDGAHRRADPGEPLGRAEARERLPLPAGPTEIGRAHVELQSPDHLVCRLLLEKKKTT